MEMVSYIGFNPDDNLGRKLMRSEIRSLEQIKKDMEEMRIFFKERILQCSVKAKVKNLL
jgi:hypothetical protein